MRSLLRGFDRLTGTVVGIGLAVGLAWVLLLPLGIALSGVVAVLGTVLLAFRRRWLEIGLLLLSMGLVPLLAYRWFGAPVVATVSGDRLSMELMAPGAAYVFFVIGLGVAITAGWLARGRGRPEDRAS